MWMSTRWPRIMRKSIYFGLYSQSLIGHGIGIESEQKMRKRLRSFTTISQRECYGVSVVQTLICPTRMTTVQHADV